MLDIVMIDDEYMHMFAKRLAQFSRELSGQHYVSMVLRYFYLWMHSTLWVLWWIADVTFSLSPLQFTPRL
jgi:hypothetical protein